MKRQKRTVGKNDVIMLTGWLFADLLLGLMIIFLVSTPTQSSRNENAAIIGNIAGTGQVSVSPLAPSIKVTLTSPVGSTTTAEVKPTATPRVEESVSLRSITITITTIPDKLLGNQGPDTLAAERQSVVLQVKKAYDDGILTKNDVAGLVLTFGGTLDQNEGSKVSAEVNRLLKSNYSYTFGNADTRDYLNFGLARGVVEVEVFLFAKR